MDEKTSRLKKWVKGSEQPPYKLILFPTSLCNLRCKFCKSRKFLEEETSDNEWLDIVDEGLDIGVEEWWITGGGEPFMRRELTLEIIEKIKKEGKYCDLMTNGTLLQRKDIDKLVNLGLDRILISLNGPFAEVDDYLRGKKGSFMKTISSIKTINEIKEDLGVKKPRIQLSSVVNSKNYSYLPELYELANRLGVDELELHQMLVYQETRESTKGLILTSSEKEHLKEILEGINTKKDLRFDYSALELSIEEDEKIGENKSQSCCSEKTSVDSYFCLQPFYTLLIDMIGEVAPCCPGGSDSRDVNLTERGLKEVWYGDYLTEIRNKIKRGERMEFCQNCGVNNLREDVIEEVSM